ncbi:hypothetical protein OIU77_017229 [Salix suchowensis]|uniref:Uncharacterized protein n=1 Tax=Salix suchowensis TaxID=1278906 RepID=A0ABQ8ZNJ7_9ROSI|nr:hypothetical protein OIU77_017229 [Salix suchowensis]
MYILIDIITTFSGETKSGGASPDFKSRKSGKKNLILFTPKGKKRRQSQGRRKSQASYCEERANRVERERYQSRARKLKVEQPVKAVTTQIKAFDRNIGLDIPETALPMLCLILEQCSVKTKSSTQQDKDKTSSSVFYGGNFLRLKT